MSANINQMTPDTICNARQGERLEKALRMQGIIAELSMNLGMKWASIDASLSGRILDIVNGSFGLHSQVVLWADEFDGFWQALPEGDERRESFLESIDDYFSDKFAALISSVA